MSGKVKSKIETKEKKFKFPYLETIGLENIASYFRHANKLKGSPLIWISVGSGTGEIEFRLSKSTNTKIICVDPEDEKEWARFNIRYPKSGKCIRPHYKFTKDLISEKKELIGNCGLLLLWPEGCGVKPASYDMEAITLLEPKIILMVYEPSGGSGGPGIQKWVRSFHPDSENLDSALTKLMNTGSKGNPKEFRGFPIVGDFPKHKYNFHSFYAVWNVRGPEWLKDENRDEICILLRDGEILEKEAEVKLQNGTKGSRLISGVRKTDIGKKDLITENPEKLLQLQMIAMMKMMTGS